MFEPGSPSWQPRTEADIEAARLQGHLTEGHHLDIKREIPAGAAGNKELAKAMASFAIDGGALVVEVDEATPLPLLKPVSLKGLPERIEQVGLQGVTEPLIVRTIVVPSDADPDKGFVVVVVPPSGRGPHMVDGRYYGRNDKTKYTLSRGICRCWQSTKRAADLQFSRWPCRAVIARGVHFCALDVHWTQAQSSPSRADPAGCLGRGKGPAGPCGMGLRPTLAPACGSRKEAAMGKGDEWCLHPHCQGGRERSMGMQGRSYPQDRRHTERRRTASNDRE